MEKINIAELLKDCPSGMELDCTMFDDVTFEGIKQDEYPIIVKIKEPSMFLSLTKTGCWNLYNSAKCVIFPKGKTTWEGFVPPCNFKDGDIVATKNGLFIGIVKIENGVQQSAYVAIYGINNLSINISFRFERFATEKEKEKLFNAIKANGYKWNEETKTLEKVLNKFDITTLIPFESRVLVRGADGDLWKPAIYGFSHPKGCYVVGGVYWKQCIPYEENKHLLGTADDCDEYFKTWK